MRKECLKAWTLILLLGLLAGCGNQRQEEYMTAPGTRPGESREETAAPSSAYPLAGSDNVFRIMGSRNRLLGQVAASSSRTAVTDGIFYSRWEPAEYAATAVAEYRFFSLSDGRDVLLGTVENQGYEAIYARTELDGRIYTLALEGDPRDSKADTLWLLAFDPAEASMRLCAVSRLGGPYAFMTAARGKLLIVNHEMAASQYDVIYEFDPASGSLKEAARPSGSARAICPAADGFYLLRLEPDSGELFLERYDLSFQKISEVPLNPLLLPAVQTIHGVSGEEDAKNELRMLVSGFAVREERYLFYENFSITRLAVDLKTGEALLAEDDLWSLSKGSGEPVFYQLEFDAEEEKAAPKILALQAGMLQELAIERPGEGLLLRELSCSADGNRLFLFAGSSPEKSLLYVWEGKK